MCKCGTEYIHLLSGNSYSHIDEVLKFCLREECLYLRLWVSMSFTVLFGPAMYFQVFCLSKLFIKRTHNIIYTRLPTRKNSCVNK